MGAIGGFYGKRLTPDELKPMICSMERRAPEGCAAYTEHNWGLLRSRQLQDPQKCLVSGNRILELAFDGEIYNAHEIREDLEKSGCQFQGDSDEELVLQSFALWGKNCLDKLNGVFAFAIWEQREKKFFLARDRMGVRPLFYRCCGGLFLFASEMKTILAAPGVRAELDAQGAEQLILLGPGRIPGSGIFRDIHALEPGCWGIYERGCFTVHRYWRLLDREHRDTFEQTAQTVQDLVMDSISRQMDDRMGTFLSGGLDSSIITALCAEEFRSRDRTLSTFSVDYVNNNQYFEPGKFQPESDDTYIRQMTEAVGSIHQRTVLSPRDLVNELEEATIARDLPGMGDVDFSLLAFCKQIRRKVPIALSGECADEIFGGYPWYRDPEIRGAAGFPWAQNTRQRCRLLAHGQGNGESYLLELYEETCRNTDVLPGLDPKERRIREMVNLNMSWFMQTLLERNDRLNAGLNIRVPFCDYRIAEYLYSVPWEMKDYGGREKGLLRYAVRGLLPEAVRLRKKSPYPKTFDPGYECLVTARLRTLLSQDSALWYLVDRETVKSILREESPQPWYGQLMRRPQFIAYLLQMEFWLRHYQIEMRF